MGTRENGFTLVELTSAMVGGTILVIAFASILVFSNKQASSANRRVSLQVDMIMLDTYLREQLLNTVGDSLLIYTDVAAEQNGSASVSGSIMVTKDIENNQYRLAPLNQHLDWQKNTLSHKPVDAKLLNLNFRKINSSVGKGVDISMTISEEDDTLTSEWTLAFRN